MSGDATRSPGRRLELFASEERPGRTVWGNQAEESYRPRWPTYACTSVAAE